MYIIDDLIKRNDPNDIIFLSQLNLNISQFKQLLHSLNEDDFDYYMFLFLEYWNNPTREDINLLRKCYIILADDKFTETSAESFRDFYQELLHKNRWLNSNFMVFLRDKEIYNYISKISKVNTD